MDKARIVIDGDGSLVLQREDRNGMNISNPLQTPMLVKNFTFIGCYNPSHAFIVSLLSARRRLRVGGDYWGFWLRLRSWFRATRFIFG